MPKLSSNKVPSYRLHRQSGQAIVTLSGRDCLLGPHGSQASRTEYDRLIAEWIASGRQLPSRSLSVTELILAYWRFAKSYYRKNGQVTSEIGALNHALLPLKQLYGQTLASDFRPLALQAVRQHMIQRGWARKTINTHVQRIKRMFRWGVSQELVEPGVYQGLQAVDGLRRGRSDARETPPVRPVDDERVNQTIAVLSPSLAQLLKANDSVPMSFAITPALRAVAAAVPFESPVAAAIEVQRLTGMRSGEVLSLENDRIDRSGTDWIYTPEHHKTQHHDRSRAIVLGPRARFILEPFIELHPSGPLFRPQDAVRARRKRQRAERRSPVQPSQIGRRKTRPRRAPGYRYTTAAYRRAILYACRRAAVEPWHPHQLRHTCATKLRAKLGIEAARVVLGHGSISVTELYVERDRAAAAQAMSQWG